MRRITRVLWGAPGIRQGYRAVNYLKACNILKRANGTEDILGLLEIYKNINRIAQKRRNFEKAIRSNFDQSMCKAQLAYWDIEDIIIGRIKEIEKIKEIDLLNLIFSQKENPRNLYLLFNFIHHAQRLEEVRDVCPRDKEKDKNIWELFTLAYESGCDSTITGTIRKGMPAT